MTGIIVFALLTGVVAYKLFSILGETNEEDEKRREEASRTRGSCRNGACTEQDGPTITKQIHAELISPTEAALPEEIQAVFQGIRKSGLDFNIDNFLKGAKKAYLMITGALDIPDDEAMAKEQDAMLRALLSENLYTRFKNTLRQRELVEKFRRSQLVIEDARIIGATHNGQLVTIQIQITSRQTTIAKTESGIQMEVAKNLRTMAEWTFTKHYSVPNSMWKLVVMDGEFPKLF